MKGLWSSRVSCNWELKSLSPLEFLPEKPAVAVHRSRTQHTSIYNNSNSFTSICPAPFSLSGESELNSQEIVQRPSVCKQVYSEGEWSYGATSLSIMGWLLLLWTILDQNLIWGVWWRFQKNSQYLHSYDKTSIDSFGVSDVYPLWDFLTNWKQNF